MNLPVLPPPYAGYVFLAYIVALGWLGGYLVYFNRAFWVGALIFLLMIGFLPMILLLSPSPK